MSLTALMTPFERERNEYYVEKLQGVKMRFDLRMTVAVWLFLASRCLANR